MSEEPFNAEEAAKHLLDDVAPKPARTSKPKAAKASGSSLSEADIAAAKAEARERVNAAMREAERERVIADEMEAIKREEGQRTGKADKDEIVHIFIDLAEFCDRITINGVEYHHGYGYDVPRHVADGLRETMQRTHRHQMELDGKSHEEMYRRTAPVALSPTGHRPLTGEIAA